jgi:outer membrane receptor protein involved in Fe transport
MVTDALGKTNHILSPAVTFDGDIFYDDDKFLIGFNANYRSKMYVDMANEHYVPYLWTLNFYTSYRWRDYEVGLRVNNLTNKVNYCSGAINDIGEMLYFRNAGTNFNVSVKYSF